MIICPSAAEIRLLFVGQAIKPFANTRAFGNKDSEIDLATGGAILAAVHVLFMPVKESLPKVFYVFM